MKIAQDEFNYLISPDLSQDEATDTIVRGSLSIDIHGLTTQLKGKIDRAIAASDKKIM